jgi:hypothetical protein
VAERTLSELRAVDARYDDVDGMMLVFADASCEPGESFAVAVERVERGLTVEDARAEVRARHRRSGPCEPFGALLPCDAADLFLAPALSAEEMALVRSCLLMRPAPGFPGDPRLLILASGALVMTVANELTPTLSAVDFTTPRRRSAITYPLMAERVTGERAPNPPGSRSYGFLPSRSMLGELLVRADILLDRASRRPEREPSPLVMIVADAGNEPGTSLAGTVIGAEKGMAPTAVHAQIRALAHPFERVVVFARLRRIPIATFLLAEQLGEDIAGALAMWLEKVHPDETPIIALAHDHIAVLRERTRNGA